MNTDPPTLHDSGPESMTKVPHEIGKVVMSHQILQFEAVMHPGLQIVMKNVEEHANGPLFPEIALQARQEVLLAAEEDLLQIPTLVHVAEVPPLEYLYYHHQSHTNSADGHIFSLATEIFPSEVSRLEILDCVSRNFIPR
jgi:hypothetical protein